jgi:uncharacterized membrane protein YoaK (UPF0700 family)
MTGFPSPGPGGGPSPAELDADVRKRDLLLLGLTFAAGLADAVSFLGLGQIFTANMTGNVVFLALAIGGGTLLPALRSVDALLGFSLGAILAGRILGPAKRSTPWPAKVTGLLAGELALLGAVSLGWGLSAGRPAGDLPYLLIALSSVAMGLQNAAARHLAVPGLTTTVVTTALTGLMAETAALGISGPNQRRWAAAVVSLFGGAAVGGALMLLARPWPPLLDVAILGAICGIAYLHGWGTSRTRGA